MLRTETNKYMKRKDLNMNVAEILRKVAEIVDEAGDVADTPTVINTTVVVPPPAPAVKPVEPVTTTDSEGESMVSPLQQEHELLKKATGVANHVEHFAEADVEAYAEELADMKKIAGLGEEHIIDNCRPLSVNPKMNAAIEYNRSKRK